MKKLILSLFLCIAMVDGLFSQSFAYDLAKNVDQFTTDVLEKKLIAVHATDYPPLGGLLKAGQGGVENFEDKIEPQILELLNQSRATIHFSLGELVRPVGDWKSWEECKFAVVVPLKDLMPQLININCYDTFILGDFKLSSTSILVAPEGEIQCNPEGYIIYEYNPSVSSLRESVDRAIQLLDGWSVHMLDNDEENILREALYEGENINTKSFYAPLLEGKPYLSVGLRFDKDEGEHYRLSSIEMEIFSLINYFFEFYSENNVVWPIDQLLSNIEFLNINFSAWENSLDGFKMEPYSLEAFQRLTNNVNIMTNIAQLEVYLNDKYSRTLKGLDKASRNELIKRWTQLEELKSYFDQNVENLMIINKF